MVTLQFSMKVTPVDGTYDYAMPLMYNLTSCLVQRVEDAA